LERTQDIPNTRRPVRLVWSEHFERITDAIAVERKIKGWSRAKKPALIEVIGMQSNCMPNDAPESQNRHPEVAAKRSSKDAAEVLGPSPFEARYARTSG
jgi:putative endonuclease